jgi:catechol 2,3-dioxygenase
MDMGSMIVFVGYPKENLLVMVLTRLYQISNINSTMDNYKIPAQTRIGHVHLKVADLDRSLNFYCKLLGFELTMMYGSQAAFISAGGYHHHIGLNTWQSKGMPPAAPMGVGLYHTAILYPTRRDLAVIFDRLYKANYPLTGASDHGVSEAIYLDDPDGNGVELYWDKPKEQWPSKPDGSLEMFTKSLDLKNLLNELK